MLNYFSKRHLGGRLFVFFVAFLVAIFLSSGGVITSVGAQANQRATTDQSFADSSVQISLFAAETLPLFPRNGEVPVFPNTRITLTARFESQRLPLAASLRVGDLVYPLTLEAAFNEYTGSFIAPASSESVTLMAQYADSERNKVIKLHVVKVGNVRVLGNRLTPILVPDATLTVYAGSEGQETLWLPPGDQLNPIQSPDGSFSWYAENGAYILEIKKDGYETLRQPVTVTDNLLTATIGLTPDQATSEQLRTTFGRLTPEDAQTLAEFAGSASAALAVGSTALLALSFNLLGYLQYLYSLPALIMHRSRRKAYGVVYNSLSKLPVELAILRVYSIADKRLIKTIVTGKDGRYSLSLKPGQYRIEASKPNFKFPSAYLENVKDDGQYLDIYVGQTVEVLDDGSLLAPNIPLDPNEVASGKDLRGVVKKRVVRTLQKISTPSGLVLSIVACVISPSWLMAVLVVLQLVVLVLVLRLVSHRRLAGKGQVTDGGTQRPVRHAVVRVFETKYNKLVDTVLTDSNGHYAVLLGPNEYAVSFTKPGYLETIVKPLDFTKNTAATPFAVDINLERE